LLFDANEEFESPFSHQINIPSGKDNNRSSFINASQNKANNTSNTKNLSSNNLQKEAPKKRNIWDDEDIDDF